MEGKFGNNFRVMHEWMEQKANTCDEKYLGLEKYCDKIRPTLFTLLALLALLTYNLHISMALYLLILASTKVIRNNI